MVAIPYIIIILAYVVLGVVDINAYGIDWPLLLPLVIPPIITGIVHTLMKHSRCYDTEYLGGYITAITHHFPWIEEEVYFVEVPAGRDSNGNTRYRTERRVRHIYHSDRYDMTTSISPGSYIDSYSFQLIANTWRTNMYSHTVVQPNSVTGFRETESMSFSDVIALTPQGERENPLFSPFLASRFFPVTEKHSYKNKLRNSHSIFRFEKITTKQARQLNLHDYPSLVGFDQPAVIGVPGISQNDATEYQFFNAVYGAKFEVHVFVLGFPAEYGVEKAMQQQAYWEGGNKNEFVVCLGIDGEQQVKWCYPFSWMDEPTLAGETQTYFTRHPKLDLHAYLMWLIDHLDLWHRKQFADFNYLQVDLSRTQMIWLSVIAALSSALVAYYLWIAAEPHRLDSLIRFINGLLS